MDVNLCMNDGISFFFVVCLKGYESIVKFLLNYEVDLDLSINFGCNFLFLVSLNGYVGCV